MAEQELNLLQFSSGRVAPARTAATKIVRGKLFNSGPLGAFPYDVPDDVLRETISPYHTVLADRSKYATVLDTGCCRPRVNSLLHPIRNRNRPNMASFSDQIDNRPMPLPLLNPFAYETDRFRTPQTTTQQ